MRKHHKHMNLARRKMSHIIDELYTALLHYGSADVDLHITKEEDGLHLIVKGNFAPQHKEDVLRMGELLDPPVRSPAMVEEYWELAGEDQYTSESEMSLVGMMSDATEFKVDGCEVNISLFVAF